MKFKYYDLMAHLVPGLVIYLVINLEFKELIPEITALPLLAVAFIIGYFNNTLSSWLETFYHFLSGGNPISKFFNGNGIWKVSYYNGSKIVSLLKNTLVLS